MAGILVDILESLIRWVIIFPLLWIVSTPVILVAAAFRKGPYLKSVREMFRGVTEWWLEHGFV